MIFLARFSFCLDLFIWVLAAYSGSSSSAFALVLFKFSLFSLLNLPTLIHAASKMHEAARSRDAATGVLNLATGKIRPGQAASSA